MDGSFERKKGFNKDEHSLLTICANRLVLYLSMRAGSGSGGPETVKMRGLLEREHV